MANFVFSFRGDEMKSLFMNNKKHQTTSHQDKMPARIRPHLVAENKGSMTLARLISLQLWHQVENTLFSTPVELIEIDDRMAITKENILHFTCRFDAPQSAIELIASKYPKSLHTPDNIGRYPIHVASKYGASPEVIQFLICENFAASGVPDDTGKTPIHYAAQYYSRGSHGSVKEMNENMLQVVRLLKASAPESFNLEDNQECNAIEYALESNVDIKVIKAIQRAARDDWRELKKKHGVPHDELAQGLERMAFENRKILLEGIMNTDDEEMEVCDKPDVSVKAPVGSSSLPLAKKSYFAESA